MPSLTGRVFGNYQILERVGRGGMASVYRARERRTKQIVAIKFISPALAEHEKFISRFRREVNVVARLDHPNIIPVWDYGEQNGYAYQVMPFLNFGTLTDRLEQGPLSLEAGGNVLDQVASALAFAHQHGVIHRDVKPSNILIDPDGNALLADFGMAHLVEASESLTGSAVVGTPAYMAPEQVQGEQVDARCDQYALGVILFQLATGTLPFEADTPMGYLIKHVNEPFPAARKRNPLVPEAIDQVILKATAKDPAERFADIAEMNRTLQAALAHVRDPSANTAPVIELPGAGLVTVADPPKRSRKTLRIAGVLAAVLFFVLAVPVFASGIVDFLERAASPAEGSLLSPMAEVTLQMATIEALSTELASSMDSSESDVELAVVQTLAAGGFAKADKDSETSLPTQKTEPSQSGKSSSGEQPVIPSSTSASTGGTSPTSTIEPASPTPVPPTPTASHTLPPSSTSEPVATQDACSQVSLGGFDVVDGDAVWTVDNLGSGSANLTRILLDWPASNGALGRIRFGESSIWNGSDDSPPSDISSGWTGNRELKGGRSKQLRFEFTIEAEDGEYDLQVVFVSDC